MSDNESEVASKVNWTPIVLVVGGSIGVYAIIKALKSGEEERRKEAERILEDWRMEWETLNPYVESIFYGGREPTDSEMAIMDSMMKQMELKEITIQRLSTSTFQELGDIARTLAKNWWLVPVVVLTPIAGYVAFKLVKGWFQNRPPRPPTFKCPVCGEIFSSEFRLREHTEQYHPPTKANIATAQSIYRGTGTWVQGLVATDSIYSRAYGSWSSFSLGEIAEVAWASTLGSVYGMAGAAGLGTLAYLPYLLLI